MKIPIKITDPSDYVPGTHKAKIVKKPVWLVEIVMPKSLGGIWLKLRPRASSGVEITCEPAT
jgi:hypothetical protein